MTLSQAQQIALDKMEVEKWYSPHDLKVSLATLEALQRKGKVIKKYEVGYLFYPRLHTKFKLKSSSQDNEGLGGGSQ